MAGKTYTLKTILSCVDQVSPALTHVRRQLRTVDRVFANVSEAAVGLAGKLAAPLTFLGGAGLLSLQDSVRTYMDLGGAIDDAAQRAGVASTALQSLRFAAQMGGMQAETMDKALSRLTQRMGMAAAGKGEDLAQLFKTLGIHWKDAEGNIKNAAEVMRQLAEAVRVNESSADRLRILTAAFGGEVAAQLVPVLQDGAAGLDAMATKAKEMGLVFSKEDVQAAAAFGDTMEIFNSVIQSVQFSIGAKLAPVLSRFVGQLQQVIIANRELISQRIERIVQALIDTVEKVDFGKLIDGFFDFIESIGRVVDAVGGFKYIIMALGAVLGASLLSNIINLATNLWSLLPALTALGKAVWGVLGPWGLLVGAITTLLVTNWDTVTAYWEKLKTLVSGVYDWINEKIQGLMDLMPDWLLGSRGDVFVRNNQTVQEAPMVSTPLISNSRGMEGTVNIRVASDEGSRVTVEGTEASDGVLNVEQLGQYSFVDY